MVTLENTFGATYLGVVVSGVFFGIACLQTLVYYQRFPNDRKIRKISVALLWILELTTFALIVHVMYYYLIRGWGNILILDSVVWSLKLQTIITVINIWFVQSLYVVRIWLLGKQTGRFRFVSVIAIVAVAIGYGVGTVLIIELYKVSFFTELKAKSWAIYMAFATATVIDIVITSGMCLYLQHGKTQGFTSLNTTLDTLTQYVISSGLTTGACSSGVLIAHVVQPDTLIFIGFQFLHSKLYVISFLAMLNAREIRKSVVVSVPDQSTIRFASLSMVSSVPTIQDNDTLANSLRDKPKVDSTSMGFVNV